MLPCVQAEAAQRVAHAPRFTARIRVYLAASARCACSHLRQSASESKATPHQQSRSRPMRALSRFLDQVCAAPEVPTRTIGAARRGVPATAAPLRIAGSLLFMLLTSCASAAASAPHKMATIELGSRAQSGRAAVPGWAATCLSVDTSEHQDAVFGRYGMMQQR